MVRESTGPGPPSTCEACSEPISDGAIRVTYRAEGGPRYDICPGCHLDLLKTDSGPSR